MQSAHPDWLRRRFVLLLFRRPCRLARKSEGEPWDRSSRKQALLYRGVYQAVSRTSKTVRAWQVWHAIALLENALLILLCWTIWTVCNYISHVDMVRVAREHAWRDTRIPPSSGLTLPALPSFRAALSKQKYLQKYWYGVPYTSGFRACNLLVVPCTVSPSLLNFEIYTNNARKLVSAKESSAYVHPRKAARQNRQPQFFFFVLNNLYRSWLGFSRIYHFAYW